jgi:hypothetical protein
MALTHNGQWEFSFDSWLCPRVGWHPDGLSTTSSRANQPHATADIRASQPKEKNLTAA